MTAWGMTGITGKTGITGITDTAWPALLKLNLSLLVSTSWALEQSGGVGKIGLLFSEYIGEEQ